MHTRTRAPARSIYSLDSDLLMSPRKVGWLWGEFVRVAITSVHRRYNYFVS